VTRRRDRRDDAFRFDARHRDHATGLYRDTRSCAAGDALELAALPGARIAVVDLLPKRC